MTGTTKVPAEGDLLRLEGETFVIDASEVYVLRGGEKVLRPGILHANLPPNIERVERKQYDILFNGADAVWSDKHGAWCLRGRGVYVHPETGVEVDDAERALLLEAGVVALWRPDTF